MIFLISDDIYLFLEKEKPKEEPVIDDVEGESQSLPVVFLMNGVYLLHNYSRTSGHIRIHRRDDGICSKEEERMRPQ